MTWSELYRVTVMAVLIAFAAVAIVVVAVWEHRHLDTDRRR